MMLVNLELNDIINIKIGLSDEEFYEMTQTSTDYTHQQNEWLIGLRKIFESLSKEEREYFKAFNLTEYYKEGKASIVYRIEYLNKMQSFLSTGLVHEMLENLRRQIEDLNTKETPKKKEKKDDKNN